MALSAISLPLLLAYYGNSITVAEKNKERQQSDFQFKQKQQQDTFQFIQKQERENFQFKQEQTLKRIQLDQEQHQKRAELTQQNVQKDLEIGQKYIGIAVDILNNKPSPETDSIRQWAISIINKYSEIKLTNAQIRSLQEHPLSNATVSITGIESHLGIGKVTAVATAKARIHQTIQASGDELLITVNSVETVSGGLTVFATLAAPGKHILSISGKKDTCFSYADFSIRVRAITDEDAEFAVSKDMPCE